MLSTALACASHSAPTKQTCRISTSSPSWQARDHCPQLKLPVYHHISSPFAKKLLITNITRQKLLPSISQSSFPSQCWCPGALQPVLTFPELQLSLTSTAQKIILGSFL